MDNVHEAILTCIVKKQEERGKQVDHVQVSDEDQIINQAIRHLAVTEYGVTNEEIERELNTGNYSDACKGKPIAQEIKDALNEITSSYANAKKWVDAYRNSSDERQAVLIEREAERKAYAKSWRLVMEALTGTDYSKVEPRYLE